MAKVMVVDNEVGLIMSNSTQLNLLKYRELGWKNSAKCTEIGIIKNLNLK